MSHDKDTNKSLKLYPSPNSETRKEKDMENIVLFESADGQVSLPLQVDAKRNDVWLTRQHMAELFGRDVKTIGKHVNNALREELAEADSSVVAKFATTANDGKTYQIEHYSLDMILSVGYRVKSQRGVEFRRWATDVLRRYIIDGRAENEKRLQQLGQVARNGDGLFSSTIDRSWRAAC